MKRTKGINDTIFLIDAGRDFDKIQHPLMKKNLWRN
jgi:hypothetical protein